MFIIIFTNINNNISYKIAYTEKRAQYENSITPEQKQDVIDLKQKITENKERLAQKRKVRELGRPKRAASAFILYLIDEKEKIPIGAAEAYRDWQAKITKKWNGLNKEEKGKYLDLSKKNIETYKYYPFLMQKIKF